MSYRKVRPGLFEVRYRPRGTKGPYLKRRIPGTAKEVRAWLAQQTANRLRRKAGLPVNLSWQDAWELYVERLSAKGTTEDYGLRVQSAVAAFRDFCGLDSVGAVEPEHVESWLDSLANAKLEPATCNRRRAMVGAMFQFLARKRHIAANPFLPVDKLRESPQPPRALSPEEYAKVWHVCEQPLRDLLDFLLLTGSRFGEAAKAKLSDITPDGVWTVTDRKGGDYLRVKLPADLLRVARRQRRPGPDDGLIFHRWVHRTSGSSVGHGFDPQAPIGNDWLNECIERRCALAGVQPFTAHDLRHANGTWAADAGDSVRSVQRRLGHSDVRTTQLYLDRVTPAVVSSVVEGVRASALAKARSRRSGSKVDLRGRRAKVITA